MMNFQNESTSRLVDKTGSFILSLVIHNRWARLHFPPLFWLTLTFSCRRFSLRSNAPHLRTFWIDLMLFFSFLWASKPVERVFERVDESLYVVLHFLIECRDQRQSEDNHAIRKNTTGTIHFFSLNFESELLMTLFPSMTNFKNF